MTKAKFDPLESAKLGTTPAPTPPSSPTPPVVPTDDESEDDFDPLDPSAQVVVLAPKAWPKYKVLADCRLQIRGQQVNMKLGRIIDSAGYGGEHGLDRLRDQGLKLELIEE